MIALFISIVVGLVVLFGTASLFFKDGDDATQCMNERPWGSGFFLLDLLTGRARFSSWLTVSAIAGGIVYFILSKLFPSLAL
jgi:hypothetical protein